MGLCSSLGPDHLSAGYSLSSCRQDGMHRVVFVLLLSWFLCFSPCSLLQPPAGWCCTARTVTRGVPQPEKAMDGCCGRGRSSVCDGSPATGCAQNGCCSPALPCALCCPCLAAAPAAGSLDPPRPISFGRQMAGVTRSASSSHHVNLCDPAPHRESPAPGTAEQPCAIRFLSTVLPE